MRETIKINANRTNLNKIIKWTTSRFNEYRKEDIIELILSYINKGEDIEANFTAGTYTEATGGYGWDYKFKIKKGKITLKRYVTDKTLEHYELIKTNSFSYIPKKSAIIPYSSAKKYRTTISDRYREEKKQIEKERKEETTTYTSIDPFNIEKFNFSQIKRKNEREGDLFEYSGVKSYKLTPSELIHPFLVNRGYYDTLHFTILSKNLEDLKNKLREEYISKFNQ